MSDKTNFSITTVILLIVGLMIGAGGGYFITNNSLHPIINKLEADLEDLTLEVFNLTSSLESLEYQNADQVLEIQTLESELTSSLGIINEFEKRNIELIQDLEIAFLNFNDTVARIVKFEEEYRSEVVELDYNYTLLLMESFENVPLGSIPVDWVKDTGTTYDTIHVQNELSYSGDNCLRLHENGGDGENSKVRVGDFEDCQSLVLDMMVMVDGSFAERGVFQFYDENDDGITTIGGLIGMSWQIVQPYGFHDISELPTPQSNQWYHVEIVLDQRLQKIKVIVDGVSSEWFEPMIEWNTVKCIKFRGNYNYPADSYYDDIYIFKAQSK